jgi:hypothetical protein
VYVVNGLDAHAIVSESLVFSRQILGEATTLVTEELTEAAAWLSRKVCKNRFDVYREINSLEQPAEKYQPNW